MKAPLRKNEILLDRDPSGLVHHGGRLVLSPEGVIFATIGDGMDPNTAQVLDSLNGKFLNIGGGDDVLYRLNSH